MKWKIEFHSKAYLSIKDELEMKGYETQKSWTGGNETVNLYPFPNKD